jgi:hypothetical protein
MLTIKTRLRKAVDLLPYIRTLRNHVDTAGPYSPGHFHTPIPDSADVEHAIARARSESLANLERSGVSFNKERQLEFLSAFAAFYDQLPFPEHASDQCRFHYEGSPYPYPDAIFLYSFLRQVQPKQMIEVGSGYSSALILDTVERFFTHQPTITLIEPNPDRLKRLLKPTDLQRVTLLEQKVQQTPLDLFASLNPDDLLFIDSSHVVKCGSDVAFLLFDVLPRVRVGVYVHFHDIMLPFEYPEEWLRDRWFWNEAYFLRAFLSHNDAWEVVFFNNYVRTYAEDFLKEKMPLCLKDVGGSLYIRRIAA